MGEVFNEKLEIWFTKALSNLNENGITQDLHIDELFEDENRELSGKEVFERCCLVFNCLIEYIDKEKINESDLNIFLNIDLLSESNQFLGKPESLQALEEDIEMNSVPEIIIYRDTNPHEIPLTELYRVPILHGHFINQRGVQIFYKEYRLFEDLLNNYDYTREINLVYMK